MKWLRITNRGTFDVAGAVNMLGASVKETRNPIGLYGSGTKFAMAQAVRDGISVKIGTGGKLYHVGSQVETFRGVDFQKVVLKSETGKVIKTPMTTDFGKEDWKDRWFIFREFYSNALDEGSKQLEVVDGLDTIPGCTSIFLPYNHFCDIHKNLSDYFTDKPNRSAWVGNGRIFRRGVYVGQFEGTKLCMHKDVQITESRTVDMYSAFKHLSYLIQYTDITVDVIVELLQSSLDFQRQLEFDLTGNDARLELFHQALSQVFGNRYCICPNVDEVCRDIAYLGMKPVVLPDTWIVTGKQFNHWMNFETNSGCRSLNEDEQKALNSILKKVDWIIGNRLDGVSYKVFGKAEKTSAMGTADFKTNTITIRSDVFQDESKLLEVVIHEAGHLITGCRDYDRGFTAFFVNKLVEISK